MRMGSVVAFSQIYIILYRLELLINEEYMSSFRFFFMLAGRIDHLIICKLGVYA